MTRASEHRLFRSPTPWLLAATLGVAIIGYAVPVSSYGRLAPSFPWQNSTWQNSTSQDPTWQDSTWIVGL